MKLIRSVDIERYFRHRRGGVDYAVYYIGYQFYVRQHQRVGDDERQKSAALRSCADGGARSGERISQRNGDVERGTQTAPVET